MTKVRHICRSTFVSFACLSLLAASARAEDPAESKVSYYRQIRPVLQANCHGCHQPAKANGKYVMTSFSQLLKAGESGEAAILPGKADESYLIGQITPDNGEAEMPKGKPPLHASEIALIRKWVQQGAVDDTPSNAKVRFDAEHPPIYSRPPAVTSIDFSPDGQWIAVAGYHEVLLHKADGSGIAARLIGESERIESVRFSPDGTKLAVAGGKPGRMGEIQIWDVKKRELLLSHSITFDTLYGASWSPDGKKVAFGCSDKTTRAIDAATGEQVLFQGAHTNWVLDTVWNPAGDHVISVGRDRTAKLTHFETERFIDNITSITPGALAGGIASVDTHPTRDEIIVGGADGVPRLFRIFRITKRVIGDNANLIRELEPLRGRVFSVDYSHDGKRAVAGSSLDGKGEVAVYDTDVDTKAPKDIKAILQKRVMAQSDAEKKKLAEYQKKPLPVISKIQVDASAIYAVCFSPDAKLVAATGSDGNVRIYDAESGKLKSSFAVAPISEVNVADTMTEPSLSPAESAAVRENLPQNVKLTGIRVAPKSIQLNGGFDKAQLIISGNRADGGAMDVTRMVEFSDTNPGIVTISPTGLVRVAGPGKTSLVASVGGQSVKIPVHVSLPESESIDYIRDVAPVISKLGCNAGTCHGAKEGKNGFKLSLRGYDSIYDTRALTDELASRRVNIASPDNSLMMLKATGAVPHIGGQVTPVESAYYKILRRWIADGAKLNLESSRVASIAILPTNPVVQRLGDRQQLQVVATYKDGSTRDVTAECFINSSNTDIATTDAAGLVTTLRRGEAAMLARFEGRYAATTLTVMGDRSGFAWSEPEKWNQVDELVARKLERMKILPSGLCSDAEFVRRVHLDLTGLPPTVDATRKFLADPRDLKTKRYELIDRLIGNEDFVDHWTNKWSDMLQVNRKFLAPEGAKAFGDWIRGEIAANTPYDQFARKVLTVEGSNKDNPAASYYKILRDPSAAMENTTHLWMAVRFNCNKCHDHPFERWTQDQYYETAAFFAQFGLKADPASGKRRIGGTAVEGAKPLYEVVFDKKQGDIKHDRTGELAAPKFPFDCKFEAPKNATRRQQLASWITSPDNPYFAKSYVNRVWGYLLGVGLIEPLDDIRAGNPPSNPELLDYLTEEFIKSGFNVRELMRQVCRSQTYQRSLETNDWNADDTINYSHAIPKRLSAEALFDAIHRVTGSEAKIPGVPVGTRAAQLPDAGVKLPDGFLASFGRPARESACECERQTGVALGPVMALVSGPTLANAIADPKNELTTLVAKEKDDPKLVNEIFLRVLNRPADKEEIEATLAMMQSLDKHHAQLSAAFEKREGWWKEEKPKLEAQRADRIAKATAELKNYEKQIAPQRAEEEKQRQVKITTAETELKNAETATAKSASAYLLKANRKVEWHPLAAESLAATADVKLERLADRSIRATGKADRSAYTVVVRTSLANITGLRVEALPVEGLKGNGPGLPENGNFAVTEVEVQTASLSKPKNFAKVALHKAQADALQEGFNIALAADGNPGNQNAWAIHPGGGIVHWATFESQKPFGGAEGSLLKIVIHQNHLAKNHLLARFRISATTSKTAVGLSLPESFLAIAQTPEAQRTDAQKKLLNAWFGKTDKNLAAKRKAVADAKRPLPENPGVTQRKALLAESNRPVPEDRQLTQLRSDVDQSKNQLANRRLTMAQDLTWALINSPSFLFNR